MLHEESAQKAQRRFMASSALEMGLAQNHDAQEGARLVRAFLRVTDPELRSAIVHMIESMGPTPGE